MFLLAVGIFVFQKNEASSECRQMEIQIAEAFSTQYLAPAGMPITEVTFYRESVNQSDFSGNQNYFFYMNGNEDWDVGASVNQATQEIWAFGSDSIELMHKPTKQELAELAVYHWEE